jgi:hypothetical protein
MLGRRFVARSIRLRALLKRTRIIGAAGIAALLHGECAMATWIGDVEASFFYDNNVNRAQRESDILSDSALLVRATGGRYFQLTDRTSLSLTASASREEHHRYSGLSNFGIGPAFALRTKLGVGTAAPWLRLSGSVLRLEYDNDLRTGWHSTAVVGAGQRVTERLDLRAELRYENRNADRTGPGVRGISGAAFDVEGVSAALAGTFAITGETLLTFGYTHRVGEVVSSTRRNSAIFAVSKAITPDPVFGPDFVAYTLDARSKIIDLGLSHALGARTSANVFFTRNLTYGDGGNNYYSSAIGISVLHAF